MSAIVVVGDALLDRDLDGAAERLCPDAPAPVVSAVRPTERPGGAGLAAAMLAADGHDVTLVAALGDDAAGRTLARLLRERGVRVVDLGRGGETPEKIRVRAAGQVLVRVDRGDEPPRVALPGSEVRRALAEADAVLVSDYGRGVPAAEGVRALLVGVEAPLVWDPHPRGPRPVAGADLLTPNRAEARAAAPDGGPADQARALRASTGAGAVAVTLGEAGALLLDEVGREVPVPAPAGPVRGGDVCGAGDRFATAAAAALAAGRGTAAAVAAGVAAATAMVRAGGAHAALDGAAGPPDAAAVRARGGRVVATGGCFDLLHAGHVAMLEAARALGDHLVVLLNSDASVRRLKGSDRPLVEQEDRAAVLRALRCVDEVRVFDEDTPERALAELAPDVWAKGADYDADDLPEAAVVRAGGGEVVVLPYIAGRSTTRLIEEVAQRAER
ncbi:D-glycero-beta-D-manno-heptose 1-phosphate adenylyltransferase [Miltoncostaea marina]|uniref:D-glycero-beta-D-manno-heptose 1-phosphate adenylyltransferase n=1 Tax=Miltoncostaea marina TaxID=2843215 RepID=UPI001C3C9F66|nr:D-glycero-beta-D-manno-heptose 1-phosphate adenylyltransferase [Miltoncostaea marina]